MITFRICYLSLSFRMIRIVIVIHDDQVDHMWNISQIVKPTGCEPELHRRRMWERRRFRQGWIHWLISLPPISIFLGPRGPLVEPSIFPSRPPVSNNFSWVNRWAVTLPSGLRYPSNHIFYESWWRQLSNSDRNTNTKTNTDTNTNTGTNKGKTNDSYDVIYCLKGDDKRILNMICYRQGL